MDFGRVKPPYYFYASVINTPSLYITTTYNVIDSLTIYDRTARIVHLDQSEVCVSHSDRTVRSVRCFYIFALLRAKSEVKVYWSLFACGTQWWRSQTGSDLIHYSTITLIYFSLLAYSDRSSSAKFHTDLFFGSRLSPEVFSVTTHG